MLKKCLFVHALHGLIVTRGKVEIFESQGMFKVDEGGGDYPSVKMKLRGGFLQVSGGGEIFYKKLRTESDNRLSVTYICSV